MTFIPPDFELSHCNTVTKLRLLHLNNITEVSCVERRTAVVQDAVAKGQGFPRFRVIRPKRLRHLYGIVAMFAFDGIRHLREVGQLLLQDRGNVKETRLNLRVGHRAADDDACP